MSEQAAAITIKDTPHVYQDPELVVSYQTHVEVGDVKNAFVFGTVQLFYKIPMEEGNYNSGPVRTNESHGMYDETEERINRRSTHLGNCESCGHAGPSGVECRMCMDDDPPEDHVPKHYVRFLYKSQGKQVAQPVQPIALANALGVWNDQEIKLWNRFELEEKFYNAVDPDWYIPKSGAKVGGLDKTRVLIGDDGDESEDEEERASTTSAKKLAADWDRIDENKKRHINWCTHTLSPAEVKQWRKKVHDKRTNSQAKKKSTGEKRKRASK